MPYKGSCHCRATVFVVEERPDTATYCTCSICAKRGALWAYYAPRSVRLDIAAGSDTIYRWNTGTVEHHFCSICGCTTYTRSPDFSGGAADFGNPRIAINVRLLDDVDPGNIPIERIDGKNLW